MRCPFCKKAQTRVLESRQSESALRRRRECIKCQKRFTTYERQETTNILVVKRSGERQQFTREKLRRGLQHACEKRPVSSEQIERLIDWIEDQVKRNRSGEITSKRIGELVMRKLKKIDKVAYIRFASIYLEFKDPEDFERALEEFMKKRG